MQKRPTLTVKPAARPIRKESQRHPVASDNQMPWHRTNLPHDSLAFRLLGAARSVEEVLAGTALPQALNKLFGEVQANPSTRGAIQDIAYRSMRQLGRSQALLGLLASRAPQPALLHALLCCALGLLTVSNNEAEPAPYDDFTLVDQAVRAAAAHPDLAHAKGMVNAVLRRFLREREPLTSTACQQPTALWNYPQWWIDAVKQSYPNQWQDILTAGNIAPPLTLRINRRKTSVEEYMALLQKTGMTAQSLGPYALALEKPVPVNQIPGFAQGLVSVQDAAAQLAAPLLDLADGMRVLDACAAPGGKTGHMLECAALDLLALDSDSRRLPRIAENLERLELSARLEVGDAQMANWWDGKPFDRILADVPCTASGIVRRHPDIRWLRRKSDAQQLAQVSARILDNLWQMLRPGGKLLFVTCSLWPQESEGQAAAFAMRQRALRLAAPGQLLPVASENDNHDGLFYALFEKPGL